MRSSRTVVRDRNEKRRINKQLTGAAAFFFFLRKESVRKRRE
jgi:hypothetical protein